MATLLLELFSEEIPSRMQRGAAEQLQRLVLEGFKKSGLVVDAKSAKTFVSPRHLAIQVFGLPSVQPDVSEERRGPKIGAPEQALKGFLSATGLTLDQCEQRDGYYYATIERKGRAVADVVKEICESALTAFVWPKSMRWGAHALQWVRPLHRIACLLDDTIVPVQFGHLTASNVTEGHRFLAPTPITIAHAENYEAQLLDAKIIVDFAARRAKIAAEIAAVASASKLSVIADEDLLNEVTGLVEWPVPLLCEFDAKFLDLPPEVLISEMKNHQRYFALTDATGSPRHSSEGVTAGKLTNQFITVANMVNADGGAKVREGNARVVRARLADGEFYWEQDRKTSLEDWGKKLSDVVFHAKVGMMDAKVARIEALAVAIAKAICHSERSEESGGTSNNPILRCAQDDYASVRRAAQLCKADLTSGMVGEFPELQGIMGRYYALAQGESPDVADAIRDHYKPLGAGDSVPESPLAAIIAIADKLDSIISLFTAGEKPTGSKDPLALRRAANGIMRILLEKEMNINLAELIALYSLYAKDDILRAEYDSYLNMTISEAGEKNPRLIVLQELIQSLADILDGKKELGEEEQKLIDEIKDFFIDRLKFTLRDEGIHHDIIESAAPKADIDFIPSAVATRTRNLAAWLSTPAGTTTLAAIKRAMNILAAEEKKSKTTFAPSTSAAAEPSEKALVAALAEVGSSLRGNDATPEVLEALTAPIDWFFDREKGVLVTEEGHREARLGLLAAVRDAANQIADFSKIEG
jgi:glycyl-tRNA synthetase beta chain